MAPPSEAPDDAGGLPRWLLWLAWGTLACAVINLFGLWPLQGGDLPEHLTVGRWIWANGTVPKVDVFTYKSPGEFIAHSWLSELAFYLLERTSGPDYPLGVGASITASAISSR